MEWLIKRLIKVGAKVAYHGRRWQVHVASAFPLARYYQAVFAWRARWKKRLTELRRVRYAHKQDKRGFFIHMTTVLPSSCLLRHHPGLLRVAGAH